LRMEAGENDVAECPVCWLPMEGERGRCGQCGADICADCACQLEPARCPLCRLDWTGPRLPDGRRPVRMIEPGYPPLQWHHFLLTAAVFGTFGVCICAAAIGAGLAVEIAAAAK